MTTKNGTHGLDLTFQTKLMISMCALVLFTGAVVIAVADRGGRTGTQALADSLFREVSGRAVSQTKAFVMRAPPVAESLAQLANKGLAVDDLNLLAPQLLVFLKSNPGLTWVLYGDETGDYAGATRYHDGRIHIERSHFEKGVAHFTEHEVRSDGTWELLHEDDTRGYDPRTRPFYKLAKEKGRLAWTAPYMFFSQGVPGISCVMPIKNAEGQTKGVFSVEFDLAALSKFVATLSISEHSRIFLFTPDQQLLAHPNDRNIKGKTGGGGDAMPTLADTRDPIVDVFRQHLQPQHVQGAGDDEFHSFEFEHEGVGYMASTTVFPIGDGQQWVVGAIAPQSDFLGTMWRMRWYTLLAATAVLGVAALLAAEMSRRIFRPIEAIIGFMKRVGGGDLDANADIRGGREFRELSAALNQMIADLRERLQLRSSLEVAMNVQKSLLPAGDPVSPLLDVAGRSKYCDQTGGDYYDFIDVAPLAPDTLLVAVGDVMGHGIPAALVMATARAALRTSALKEDRLAELMARTNQVLAADNRHKRFMTLSLLLVDARSRVVRWASAGHDPAIIFDPESQSFTELEGGDLLLGVIENSTYREFTSKPLTLNSVMVIGTDGVWEMFNEKKERYGKQRLYAVMRDKHAGTAAEISEALEADLAAFRGVQNPIDDVTFVIIKFVNPAGPEGNI